MSHFIYILQAKIFHIIKVVFVSVIWAIVSLSGDLVDDLGDLFQHL